MEKLATLMVVNNTLYVGDYGQSAGTAAYVHIVAKTLKDTTMHYIVKTAKTMIQSGKIIPVRNNLFLFFLTLYTLNFHVILWNVIFAKTVSIQKMTGVQVITRIVVRTATTAVIFKYVPTVTARNMLN